MLITLAATILPMACAPEWDRNDLIDFLGRKSYPRHACTDTVDPFHGGGGGFLSLPPVSQETPEISPPDGVQPPSGVTPPGKPKPPTAKPPKPNKPKGPPNRSGCNGRGCEPGSGRGNSEGRENSRQDRD